MTDRIDLDDLETEADEDESETSNRGDWLWRDDESAAPADEHDFDADSDASTTGVGGGSSDADAATETETDGPNDAETNDSDRMPAPHVPKPGGSTPVGIPAEGDGDGTGTGTSSGANATGGASDRGTESMRPMGAEPASAETADDTESASGPHGGDADEMTTAVTYGAVRRLEHPAAVFADAAQWSDWVGIVGDVPAHVIQKFQRDNGIDVDFFNGTGTGPGERLAEIDRNSMFYADRMVVVGREGTDEPIAEAAEWEFVPLETAAEKAGWELADDA